jgi:hypothetical protein
MSDEQRYIRAKREVKLIRGFYLHCSIYALVIIFLIALNVMSGGAWWVQWVAGGWGAAIAVHAFLLFGLGRWLGPDWEEKKIAAIMAKRQAGEGVDKNATPTG